MSSPIEASNDNGASLEAAVAATEAEPAAVDVEVESVVAPAMPAAEKAPMIEPGVEPAAPEGADRSSEADDLPLNAEEEVELLTFHLGEEEYGIDIAMVQEISKVVEMTPVPRTPPYIKGIITLRGNVIPVFDMHSKLGLPPFEKKPKNRFIICATGKGRAAILVDRVNDVVRLLRRNLQAPPSGVAADDNGYIKNIARYGDRLLILLETERVLQLDRVEKE